MKPVTVKLGYTQANGKDDWGNPVIFTQEKTVKAEKKSVTGSEFYRSAAAGFSPEMVFEMYTREYAGADYLIFEGVRYSVLRTFEVSSDRIEVTVHRRLADGH